ncbi:cytoskeleton-associated protein 2 [Nilaparvata lugens]|uniref:cytoskeleton-associated protein 2 n=1 Tax=Nilaparvata lugens TaxID=108931 RepID=UPI00193E7BE8|nr:cytoskeleton-associated protein 2 [Nilaparvata lugens]
MAENQRKAHGKFPSPKVLLAHKEGSRLPIRQPFKEPNTNSNSAPLKTSAPKSRPTNLPAIVIETIPQEKENSKGDLTINLESTEPPCSLTREQEDLASCGDCKPLDETTIVLDSENLKETTVKALHELLTLIHTGYPWESCKEWLTALGSRNPDAESLPDYWECLAALEEKQGDMQMAVDSYQRALMRGAQVSHIDVCLDSLFEKMNALNLECQPYTPRQTDGKMKNGVDAKNIFKSTVIQFALMQQKVKTFSSESGVNLKNLNYIATPVRRSTRQSLFTSKTPQRCTSSIKNLMSEDQENVQFKPNKALLFDD